MKLKFILTNCIINVMAQYKFIGNGSPQDQEEYEIDHDENGLTFAHCLKSCVDLSACFYFRTKN